MKILKEDCHSEMVENRMNAHKNSLHNTPIADGYHMPAEYEPHRGCIMIWPQRPGSWPHEAKEARKAFADVIRAIAKSETVYLVAGPKGMQSAKEQLSDIENIVFYEYETDDAWARDVAPTFLLPKSVDGEKLFGEKEKTDRTGNTDSAAETVQLFGEESRQLRCVNWEFNAWGGTYNGLYANWDKDNAFALEFTKEYKVPCYDARPFVLEGGSIHSDGEGTILVTESCLLSKGRNPELSRQQIEENLKRWLGAEKVIWLPYGIYNDETDEHVDNVCAFVGPAQVVLAWTEDENDPQYAMSKADYDFLKHQTDARGRAFIIHKLPIPDYPVLVRQEDLAGYEFEEGEDVRQVGDRLAASYVNFYFSNDAVIMPAFGEENRQSDLRARDMLQRLCPERKIEMIDARAILLGGGNIHCITQQIPL